MCGLVLKNLLLLEKAAVIAAGEPLVVICIIYFYQYQQQFVAVDIYVYIYTSQERLRLAQEVSPSWPVGMKKALSGRLQLCFVKKASASHQKKIFPITLSFLATVFAIAKSLSYYRYYQALSPSPL